MDESKIDLTERLRREGRWAEASKFKDETVKKLRKEGLKRAEAGEQAWRKMAEVYPPLPAAEPIPGTAAEDEQATDLAGDKLTQLVCGAAEGEVERWQEKYGVTLLDDARAALAGEVVAYCWALGLMGEMPGLTSRQSNLAAALEDAEGANSAPESCETALGAVR
ncbi:MAG: hypothetical protein ABIP48_16815 [Planctomycetota bacterium]